MNGGSVSVDHEGYRNLGKGGRIFRMDQSKGDLEHARNDLTGGFYDWACFSAQQAAEEVVKSVFQKLGEEAWGHSIVRPIWDKMTERGVEIYP